MKTLINICFNVTLMILTLIVIHSVSVTQAHACSPAYFYVKFPGHETTNVPLNTGIDFVALGVHADSDDFVMSLKDEEGNVVDGVLSDSEDYGPRGSIFDSHSIIFQPSVNLSPNTTYTFTYEDIWLTENTLTFTTGNSLDTTAPKISNMGIASVEFDHGEVETSCDFGSKGNIIYLDRTDDSVTDGDNTDVFLRFYIAATLADIDWDMPKSANYNSISRVNFGVTTVGDYVMAVNAIDAAGNVSCTYYAEFQTLDGTGNDIVQVDTPFILLEDCEGELAGTPLTTNGTTPVVPPIVGPITGGGATNSSSGCQLNVATATGSSNLMFYCMIVLFTMICLMRRKGYTIKN